MGTKITFTKLVTPLESIQVDFGDGEGLKDYNTNEARTNGIEVPPTVEDFADITIKGQDVQVNDLKFLIDSSTANIDYRAKDIIIEDLNKISLYNGSFRTVIFNDTITNIGEIDCAHITNLRLPRNLKNFSFFRADIDTLFIPDDIDQNIIKNSYLGYVRRIICKETYPVIELYDENDNLIRSGFNFNNDNSGFKDYGTSTFRVHLTKSVNEIPDLESLYYSCNINNITVDNKNPYFKSLDGILYSKDGANLILCPPNLNLQVYNLPEGVTTIAEGAFKGNNSLTHISMPASITSIGNDAFADLDNSLGISYNGNLTNFNNISFGSHIGGNIKEQMLAQALNHATLSLTDFSILLDNNDVYTDPENPISPTITPASADGLWTHDELQSLSELIKTKKVYIDLRNTDLKHVWEEEITEELIAEEDDGGIWGSDDNSHYCTGEGGTESIRAFPSIFVNNTYLVGINMPESDNYSLNNVFKGCTNLKHVGFTGSKLWKIGVMDAEATGEDKYYIWYGMDNFVHKLDSWITILDTEEEAMAILTSENGGGLMWYYDYWADFEENPGDITQEPAPNEIELTGIRNVSSAVVMHLGKEVNVNESTIPAEDPNEPAINVASIEYDEDTVIENGIVHL